MKLRNKKTGHIAEVLTDTIEVNVLIGRENLYGYYSSLADLNEEWEDYKPKEPLIKDEKIRKAVRAWYEALPLDGLGDKRILFNDGYFCIGIYRIDCGNYDALKGIKESFYTIKELCGKGK